MIDGRVNNGGHSTKGKAGRPTKAKEEQVRRLGLNAIEKVYGSIDKYYEFIATESKGSFPHLKLLQEYVFGKPKEIIEVKTEEVDEIDYSQLSVKTLKELARASNKSNES